MTRKQSARHMTLARRSLLVFFLVLVLYVAGTWLWMSPGLVDRRIGSRVKAGMTADEVTQVIGASKAFDIPASHQCEPKSDVTFSRISIYTSGGLSLVLVAVPTTTTFCFDSADRLVTFRTRRWVDGP
jgi:hypothetical protein